MKKSHSPPLRIMYVKRALRTGVDLISTFKPCASEVHKFGNKADLHEYEQML